MKKILTFFLIISMSVSAAFAADTVVNDGLENYTDSDLSVFTEQSTESDLTEEFADDATKKAYIVLSGYGVVKGYEDGSAKPDRNVTRAEFATTICRIIGMSSETGGVQQFADVPKEHWACANINTAYELKIVDGIGGNMYSPDALLTFEQAYKMVVCALGYKNAAEAKGGYPSGYMAMAYSLKLTDNVKSAQGNVTRGDLFNILYNALSVDIMYDTATDGSQSQIFEGNTLIYNFRNRQGILLVEGVVNTVAGSSMVGISHLRDNQIEIEGIVCENDFSLSPYTYLGKNVIAFIDVNDSSSFKLMSISITPGKNEVTLINSDDVVSYADYRYRIKKADGHYSTLNINPAACLIYNGTGIEEVTSESFAVRNGLVQLIDNNGGGDIDVVFIIEYQSYVVHQVDAQNSLLTFRGDNVVSRQTMEIHAPEFDRDDNHNYYFINCKGKEAGINIDDAVSLIENAQEWKEENIAEFAPGDIVSVLWDNSRNVTVVILSDKKVIGRANQVDYPNGDIEVGGEPYSLFSYGEGIYSVAYEDIIMNYATTYYIDAFGKVIGIDTTEVREDADGTALSNHGYAYILKAGKRGLSNIEIQLLEGSKAVPAEPEIYLDDNREEVVEEVESDVIKGKAPIIVRANKTMKINGTKIRDVDDIPLNTVVEYWRNPSGEISKIETLDAGAARSLRYYNKKYKTFSSRVEGGAFMTDEDTLYFVIPTTASEPEDYEIEFSVNDGARFSISSAGTKYLFANGCPVALTAVISTTAIAHQGGLLRDNTPATVITKVTMKRAEDGEYVCNVHGYTNGMYKEYMCNPSMPDADMNGLKKGDLVQLSIDADGMIDNYRRLASMSQLSGSNQWYRSGARGKMEIVFGKVYNKEEDVLDAIRNKLVTKLEVVYKQDYSEIRSYTIDDTLSANFYLYEKDGDADAPVRLADPMDVVSIMQSGEYASDILVHLCFGDVKTVVIMR